MPLTHNFMPSLVLFLGVSTVVILLYFFEERWMLGHTFRYYLVLLISLLSLRFLLRSHIPLFLYLLEQLLLLFFLEFLLCLLFLLLFLFLGFFFFPAILFNDLQSLIFEPLLFFQKLFILLLLGLTDLEILNPRFPLFSMMLHLIDFLVDIAQFLLNLAFLLFEQGDFLGFPILLKLSKGLQLLMLSNLKLVIKNVIVNVALTYGQRLKQLVFHISRDMIQFPLQMVPHCPKIIRLITHKQMENPPLSIPHEGAYCLSCLLYTSPSPRDQRGSRMPSSA